jgi:phosphoglycerol transferase MdoB-like AlkP superfamily enzyme
MPCQGAYTLRPESAALSGRGFDQQRFDRFHPYLRPRRLAAGSLAQWLARSGWDTLFVHPHDGSFFRRWRAIPILGFARFADEQAFRGALRIGPYIADQAVADFLLDELQASTTRGRKLFAYAVTMEAHDPYGVGRLPDEADPVRQYVHHIENTDRMLARLADAIEAGQQRVLLVVFGDHVPCLPSFADPFPDTRTDYFVVELGKPSNGDWSGLPVTRPEHLHRLIRACLAGNAPPPSVTP